MIRYLLLTALFCTLPLSGAAGAEGCLTAACHPGIGALKHLHQPAGDGDCLSCHQQNQKEHPVKGVKSFGMSAKGAKLCDQCHTVLGKKKVVHAPVKEGACLSCHAPHGAKDRKLLANLDDQGPLCFGCHDEEPFNRRYLHGPVADGSCSACHDPHESDGKFLLKKGGRELCLSCHDDFARRMLAAAVVHPPVQKEPCTSCHDPHSSAAPNLLKQAMPGLCVGCHKELGKQMQNAKFPHKPVLQGKLCGSCHSSHFSKAKGLLSATDERSFCLACHNTDKLGTPPLSNMQKELAGKKNLHAPVQKGRCSSCHNPHGSDYPRLLTGNYPREFYAPFKQESYSFCLRCHDKNMLNFAETSLYTKFRDGNRNLHYLHVNGPKGRSCRACHEPHGSDSQKLFGAEGARFGEWRVRSRFQASATGGSCSPGCHRRYSYDRNARKKEIVPLPN